MGVHCLEELGDACGISRLGPKRVCTITEERTHTQEAVRVLHIVGQLGVGGAETQLLGLCSRLDRSRIESSVLSYTLSEDSLAQQFREHGVEVVEFDKFSMSKWAFFQRLRKHIKRVNPHIVHCWLYSANFWGRWAAVSCGVKGIVASERGQFILSGTVPRITERLLGRRTTWVVNARAIAKSLEDKYGVPSDKTKVIGNAVWLPEVDRANCRKRIREELQIDAGQHIVLMVGRRTWEKNYPMFVETAGLVRSKRRDTTFVAIGRSTGDQELERTLNLVNQQGHVLFVDQRDDIERWYAAADVMCLTSKSEGIPNVVLEAMWSQLPVVCTAFGSAREVIPNDEVGIIVPLDDVQLLADTLDQLLNDPHRRETMGRAAQAHVRKYHSWDAMVRAFESVYQQCAGVG